MATKNAATLEVANNEVIISRVLDAPRDIVYRMWTVPVHLKKWWGPHIMVTPVVEVDLRKGGAYRIVMRAPDGTEFPMKGNYTEITENERLAFTVDLSEHSEEWKNEIRKNLSNPNDLALTGSIIVTFEDAG